MEDDPALKIKNLETEIIFLRSEERRLREIIVSMRHAPEVRAEARLALTNLQEKLEAKNKEKTRVEAGQ